MSISPILFACWFMYTLPSLGRAYSYWKCENGAMKWIKVRQMAENQRGMNFMSLKATEFSHMLLGKTTFDGIEWKWENSMCTNLWVNNGRVIGIIIKTLVLFHRCSLFLLFFIFSDSDYIIFSNDISTWLYMLLKSVVYRNTSRKVNKTNNNTLLSCTEVLLSG